MASTAEMIRKQDAADANFYAAIKNDYDPTGYIKDCDLHPEHPGHYFYAYCVICPEDTGNGKVSDAAYRARLNELAAGIPDAPF